MFAARDYRWLPGAAIVTLLTCIFGFIAPAYITRYKIPLPSAAGIFSCFVLMLILVVAPGIPGLQLPSRRRSALLLIAWCLPYLAYAAGTGDFRWFALARVVYVAAPLLLIYQLFPVKQLERFHWQDLAIAGWLIFVLLGHQLSGIWIVPVNLDFLGRLYLIAVSAGTWVFIRQVPRLGYAFVFTMMTVRAAALNFFLFAVIAAPMSLALHFTHWNPKPKIFPGFFVDYLEIFLFIALLEELFFRGFLQTLLSSNLASAWKGQAVVSVLFGLFHILHAPFPNWRYVLLATIAGWFYGTAFVKGGNLMASALTHAMVDTVWRTLLT